MGPARAGVFKHYIHRTVQVDTQATILGNSSRKELIIGVSRMGASRDANAPTSLTAKQHAEINRDQQLTALQLERSEIVPQIKAKHGYVKDAAGADLHKQYMEKDKNTRLATEAGNWCTEKEPRSVFPGYSLQ